MVLDYRLLVCATGTFPVPRATVRCVDVSGLLVSVFLPAMPIQLVLEGECQFALRAVVNGHLITSVTKRSTRTIRRSWRQAHEQEELVPQGPNGWILLHSAPFWLVKRAGKVVERGAYH